MDRGVRQERLKQVNPKLLAGSALTDGLDREYTLNEIAIITRASPARILGLKHKGHLGVGADADVTIYTPGPDKKAMFELPRFVIKAGQVVVEQGEIRCEVEGSTQHVEPAYDEALLPDIQKWFEAYYTIQFANYPVDRHHLSKGGTQIACGR